MNRLALVALGAVAAAVGYVVLSAARLPHFESSPMWGESDEHAFWGHVDRTGRLHP